MSILVQKNVVQFQIPEIQTGTYVLLFGDPEWHQQLWDCPLVSSLMVLFIFAGGKRGLLWDKTQRSSEDRDTSVAAAGDTKRHLFDHYMAARKCLIRSRTSQDGGKEKALKSIFILLLVQAKHGLLFGKILLLGPEHKVNRVGILLSMQINRMDLRTQSRNNISVWIKYVLDNSSTTSTAAPCVSISVTVKGRTFNNFLPFKKIFVCVFL